MNTIINARQKNDKKMQWSREGAHTILQIRAENDVEARLEKAQQKFY